MMQRHSFSRHVIYSTVLSCLFISIGFALARAESVSEGRERVTLTGQHDEVQFLAGRSVMVEATVADDVFVAGRSVTFDGATVANAIVAGYDVEQRGGTATDFVSVAGIFKLSGSVQDDLVVGARSIRITSDGSVGGDARFAAETIDAEGRIGGSLRAAAERITIAGEIAGKADLLAERIVVAPNAVIGGDLIYRGEDKPEIAEGATIKGEVRQIPIELPDFLPLAWAILGIGLVIAAGWALATVLLVVVIHAVFPHLMANSAQNLLAHPWSNLGRGIALALITSVVAGGLVISVFGIPLGSALFMAMGVAGIVGLATVCACIGLYIREWRQGETIGPEPRAQIWWAVLGAFVLGLVVLIPVLGWLAVGLAVAAGLGAASGEIWQRLRLA